MYANDLPQDFKERLLWGLSRIPADLALTPLLWNKAPYRDNWQNEEPVSRDAIAADIKSGKAGGYGIRTGPVSGGIVAIDLDGPSAHPKMLELSGGEELPKTIAFTSRRPGRSQRLYRVPEKYWCAIKTKKIKTGVNGDDGKPEQVELRGSGCQSVLPFSAHPTTKGYNYLPGCAPWECEIANAPMWVIEQMLVDRAVGYPSISPPTVESVGRKRYKDIQVPVSEKIPLYQCLSKESRDLYDRGVPEGSRDDDGAKLARDLIGTACHLQSIGQAFSDDPFQMLEDYASRCIPPLSAKDAERIFKSAEKDRPGPSCKADGIENCIRGWYWREYLSPQSSSPRSDRTLKVVEHPSSIKQQPETKEQRHARLIKTLKEIEGESRASLRELSYDLLAKEEGFTKRSLKEIWRQECLDKPIQDLDLHDLLLNPPKSKEWVIEGLLELSKVYLLAAQAKTGKTPLINDWAYSVATGKPWADKFPVSAPGRVLCIQSDENIEHTKQALFLRGFGVKDASGNIQIPHGNVRFISDFSAAQYPKLKKILQEYRPRIVLIDSLTTIGAGLPYDQNSPEFAAEVLYPLTRMIGELGSCSCVITHHTNKAPTELGVDRVAGSGRITAAVDEIWALERVDTKNLSDTRRYFRWLGGHGCSLGEPFDLQLTLNLEDLTFSVDGQVLNRKAETDAERLKPILKGDFQSNKDLILEYLQQRVGTSGWTIQTIGADLNLSLGVARRDTLKLCTEGKIQRRRIESVGKGRPAYLYYYDSPDKKSPCAKVSVENSQDVDTGRNTNKDHPPGIKDQVEEAIFNPTPPDLYSQPLPNKNSGGFPQAVGGTGDFCQKRESEQKSSQMDDLMPAGGVSLESTVLRNEIAPQPSQQPESSDNASAPKLGDTVRLPNSHVGTVSMVYTDGQLCVDFEVDGGMRSGMWEPSEVNIVDMTPLPQSGTNPAPTIELKTGMRVRCADGFYGHLGAPAQDGRWWVISSKTRKVDAESRLYAATDITLMPTQ